MDFPVCGEVPCAGLGVLGERGGNSLLQYKAIMLWACNAYFYIPLTPTPKETTGGRKDLSRQFWRVWSVDSWPYMLDMASGQQECAAEAAFHFLADKSRDKRGVERGQGEPQLLRTCLQ